MRVRGLIAAARQVIRVILYLKCNVVTSIESWHSIQTMTAMWKKWHWDGLGLGLAGLCLVHCLATSVLLVMVASVGGLLVDPIIHEVGLVFAILFGLLALGKGVWQHGFYMPMSIGALGIGVMAGALTLPHGDVEILYTILGVGLLALGHDLNRRASY